MSRSVTYRTLRNAPWVFKIKSNCCILPVLNLVSLLQFVYNCHFKNYSDGVIKYSGIERTCYLEHILGYRKTLQLLKDVLEEKYEEYHWNDPDFCKAYLSVNISFIKIILIDGSFSKLLFTTQNWNARKEFDYITHFLPFSLIRRHTLSDRCVGFLQVKIIEFASDI